MKRMGKFVVIASTVMLGCGVAAAQAAHKAPAKTPMGEAVQQDSSTATATGGDAIASAGCQKLRLHGKKTVATKCFEALSESGDPYKAAEGFWGLSEMGSAQWEDAKTQFEVAVAKPGAPALWKARYGMLFHERFNDQEAGNLFAEALKQDPRCAEALLGVAEIGAANFDDKAEDYLRQAIAIDPAMAEARGLLAVNPGLVEAHELLAELLLADSRPEDAVREAQKAIALSPYDGAGVAGGGTDALDAEAVMAAAALLADKNAEAEKWFAKIRAVNAGYGEGYLLVAKQMMLNRRYPEAIAYDRKAVRKRICWRPFSG